jgi:hypothetical protein
VVSVSNNVLRWKKISSDTAGTKTSKKKTLITAKDLSIPHAYQSFLERIKTSSKPAEMVIYTWKTLSPIIKKKILLIIKKHHGLPCDPTTNIYSPESKCMYFHEMKDANLAMDDIDDTKMDVNIDISYI